MIYFFSKGDGYDPKVYDNPEDVINLFVNNQAAFDEIVPILKGNELFDYLYSIDRKSIFGPSIPKREKYLSEAEYGHICDFLNEFRPYEIGSPNGQLCFVFVCRSADVVVYHTELKEERLSRFLYYVGQNGDLKKINDNWYILFHSVDMIRQ